MTLHLCLDNTCRIDVKGIMDHPWYKLPMRPHLEEAWTKLQAEQEIVEKKVAAGAYRSKQRDAAISNLIKLAASEEFRQKVGRHGATRHSTV